MNRKEKDKNTRKIFRQGKTSLAVTLPIEMTNALKWKERQKVTVKKKGTALIIRDWRSPSSAKAK